MKPIRRTVEVFPTADELAAAFCEMGDDDQRRFLVEVAREFGEWGAYARDTQISRIANTLPKQARDWLAQVVEVAGPRDGGGA